jgi:hypothetical protein
MLYWLYDGGEVLTAVNAPLGTTRMEAIARAVDSHRRVPLHHDGFTPDEWERRLQNAEVRT